MDAERRASLTVSRNYLSILYKKIQNAKSEIEEQRDEEEEYMYNMPDNFQYSTHYDEAAEYCNTMDDAASELDNTLGSIDAAINYLKEITGE